MATLAGEDVDGKVNGYVWSLCAKGRRRYCGSAAAADGEEREGKMWSKRPERAANGPAKGRAGMPVNSCTTGHLFGRTEGCRTAMAGQRR
jgi:hypothetical protein